MNKQTNPSHHKNTCILLHTEWHTHSDTHTHTHTLGLPTHTRGIWKQYTLKLSNIYCSFKKCSITMHGGPPSPSQFHHHPPPPPNTHDSVDTACMHTSLHTDLLLILYHDPNKRDWSWYFDNEMRDNNMWPTLTKGKQSVGLVSLSYYYYYYYEHFGRLI